MLCQVNVSVAQLPQLWYKYSNKTCPHGWAAFEELQ